MNGFRFSLQTLLDYRMHIEEGLMLKLADHKKVLEEEKKNLGRLQNKELSALSELENKAPQNAMFVSAKISYITVLRERINEKVETVACKTREVAEWQKKLLEAVKQKKMLESLKEKQLRNFRNEVRKRDNKEMDELGNIKFEKGGSREKANRYL